MNVGNSRFQKEANSLLILNLLRKGPLSRIEIALMLGLQPSTVTYSIQRLLKLGILENGEKDTTASHTGRRRSGLRINASFGRVAGAEMLEHGFRQVVCDTCGKVLDSKIIGYSETTGLDPIAVFRQRVGQIVSSVSDSCGQARILGIGISIAGIIDGTIIRECWSQKLWNLDLKSFLDSFPYPVRFENDARLCAGKYVSDKGLAYVLMKRDDEGRIAIGTGLAINGRLYRGDNRRSGEYRASSIMDDESAQDAPDQVDPSLDARSMVLSVLKDVLSMLYVLDLSELYLSFPEEYRGISDDILDNDLKHAVKKLGLKIHSDVSEWDSAEGGAQMMLSEYLDIPQVGTNPNENGLFMQIKEAE